MNIFILDIDKIKTAKYMCDQHIGKMGLEATQMLCWVLYEHNIPDIPYKFSKSHFNHPCTKWCRQSLSNFYWLCDYARLNFKEFRYRRDKEHKSNTVLEFCVNNTPKSLCDIGLTQFVLAMPDKYKNTNPVIAYRNYYKNEKINFKNGPATWTKREKPEWI